MGKTKIKTHASTEAMRWAEDRVAEVERGPGPDGNDFDMRMQNEPDGVVAAQKIVDALKERGVALVQANAPQDLVIAAVDEAEALYDEGEFSPPLRVHDDRSMIQVELWRQAIQDEDKVYWISQKNESHTTTALKVLSQKISEFAGGLGELLEKEMGIKFDRFGNAMLSCYTGDRTYSFHVDNGHGEEDDDEGFPDNGMRLTVTYWINLHWNPVKRENGGGLDVYLSDPSSAPSSASAAKSAKVLRIAPHADTLAIFLSERMAHQVIPTKGAGKWFCLTMWCLNGEAMQEGTKRMIAMRCPKKPENSDDED